LAWFTASLATVGGALGAGLESDEAVREAAYASSNDGDERKGVVMGLFRLLARTTIGLLFVGHGTQKLFGWFGGGGLEGTAGFFEQLGFRPGRRYALAAGAAEAGGGLLFALGAATPLGAAAVSGSMITAIKTVHWEKGVWVSAGGYEYNLVLLAAVFSPDRERAGPVVDRRRAGQEPLGHALGARGARRGSSRIGRRAPSSRARGGEGHRAAGGRGRARYRCLVGDGQLGSGRGSTW
jgi:putative oxidoreductase